MGAVEFCSSTNAEALPIAPGKIIAGDNKIVLGTPLAVLELVDEESALEIVELVLDATELAMVELAIEELASKELVTDEATLVTDELEPTADDGADEEGALLLEAVSYSIGNKGFP